jgi:hypothetical protein
VAATKEKGREADQQGMTSKLQYTVDRHAWSSQPEFIVLSIFQSSSSSSLFFGGGERNASVVYSCRRHCSSHLVNHSCENGLE